jgi:hypothetical protein
LRMTGQPTEGAKRPTGREADEAWQGAKAVKGGWIAPRGPVTLDLSSAHAGARPEQIR